MSELNVQASQQAIQTLPTLKELGRDLLLVSPQEVAISLLRPLCCFIAYWPLAFTHHFVLATLAVAALMLFTYMSTTHDLVHRTLRLPERWNDLLLAVLEGVTLRSGHAYRLTHLQHHKRFPNEDDVEGAEPSRGFWAALACGPGHQFRLFHWAWKQGNNKERRWIAVEASFVAAVLLVAVLTWRQFPELLAYVGLVVCGSWLYPLASVWLPHHSAGATALEQTRGVRGRFIPWLLFHHTYHLEHHLYPGISSHRWAELGNRLQPYLEDAGVRFIQIP